MKTDSALNSGNSGGPLINLQGQIVGMNTCTMRGGENVGYAIVLQEIYDRFEALKNGRNRVVATPTPTPPDSPWRDGSYPALLLWEESDGYYNRTWDGIDCVTRIMTNGTRHSWSSHPQRGICHYPGHEYEGDLYVEVNDDWYLVTEVLLSKEPD